MGRVRSILLGVVLFALAVSGADHAQAIRLPDSDPYLQSAPAGDVVKVMDLPRQPEFERDDGTFIALGYLHRRTGSGEWVGYIGADNRYVSFKPGLLAAVLAAGGLSELPPPPMRIERPPVDDTPLIDPTTAWIILALVGVFAAGFVRFTKDGAKLYAGLISNIRGPVVAGGSKGDLDAPAGEWASKAIEIMERKGDRRAATSTGNASGPERRQGGDRRADAAAQTARGKPSASRFGRRA